MCGGLQNTNLGNKFAKCTKSQTKLFSLLSFLLTLNLSAGENPQFSVSGNMHVTHPSMTYTHTPGTYNPTYTTHNRVVQGHLGS